MPTARLPGDLLMHYEDDDFTDPWSTAETVILHHGNAKSSRLWYAWVPLLARDYRVIRVDARGFGRSSVPAPGYPWSLEGFARPICSISWSTSGHREGSRSPATETTCTSPSSGVQAYLDYYKIVKEQGVEAWVRQTASRRLEPGASDPRHQEWYAQEMSRTPQHVVLETLAYLATVDLTPILPKITTPALVLVGERSTMNTPDRAQGLAALLPRGKLVEVPGAGGYVQHSAPAQCVAIWREFARAWRA